LGEPLKTFFSSALVRRLAGDIARVHPGFAVRVFTNDACRGLDGLELLDRGRHIATALGAHLPPSYPDAIPYSGRNSITEESPSGPRAPPPSARSRFSAAGLTLLIFRRAQLQRYAEGRLG
jgi:hypothetical protein